LGDDGIGGGVGNSDDGTNKRFTSGGIDDLTGDVTTASSDQGEVGLGLVSFQEEDDDVGEGLRHVLVDGGGQDERTQTDGVDVVVTGGVGGGGSGDVGGGVSGVDQNDDVLKRLSGGVIKDITEDSGWFLGKIDHVVGDDDIDGGVGGEGGVSWEVTIGGVKQRHGNVDWDSGLEGEGSSSSDDIVTRGELDGLATW
jgi:hypothetical protein